jgi:hypothetical protein
MARCPGGTIAALSENEQLLEHFKVVPPLAPLRRWRRDWKWLVPMGLAASLTLRWAVR